MTSRRAASDTNLCDVMLEKKSLPGAAEGGVKLKMPVGILGHVTRAQTALDDMRKSGGVEGVVRDALKKYEVELLRLREACDLVKPTDSVQKAAKGAWIERNVKPKESHLKMLKAVLEDTNPKLQLNDEDVEKESMRSAKSVMSVGSSLARREAAAATRALEVEMEYRIKQRELEEQERQLRQQREDNEFQMRLQQARAVEEALESEKSSQKAESIISEEQGRTHNLLKEATLVPPPITVPQCLPPVSTWAGRPITSTAPGGNVWASGYDSTVSATQGLLQQVLLPQSALPIFKGDYLEFMWFMRAFEMQVERVTNDPVRRLHLLIQHLEGDAKNLVLGCQLAVDPTTGYARAKDKLVAKYGNRIRQALAFKAKLLGWPVLKKDSVNDLEKFSIQLTLCEEVKLAGGLAELDAAGTLVQLMHKLPHKLQESWQMRAHKIESTQHREAEFRDFSKFVCDLAAARNHPVYGNKSEMKGETRKGAKVLLTTSNTQEEQERTITEASSATSSEKTAKSAATTSKDKSPTTSLPVNVFQAPCVFCQGQHAGDRCRTAQQMPIKERRNKLQGVCFGCLKPNHTARQCEQRATCDKCKGRHPTVLHIERNGDGERKSDANADVSTVNAGKTATACATSSAPMVAVAVVPVRVQCPDGSRQLIVKAVLDPGSTASFITQRLVNDLRLNKLGESSTLRLTTMTNMDKKIDTKVVPGLKVTGLDQNNSITLPPMYVVKDMPYSKDDIVKSSDAQQWTHLADVPFNWCPQAEVEILIGMNVPAALKPQQVVDGQADEPYAVKTVLGWCMNGPLQREVADRAVANVVKVEEVKRMLQHLHERDFDNAYSFGEKSPSQEDNEWLCKVKASVRRAPDAPQQYQIALPFRQVPPPLRDNREQALQRLATLKRKFAANPKFKSDYIAFMAGMEEHGYVEEVHEPQPSEKDHRRHSQEGRVMYVPHHGVYHPRKPGKLRVVFNCSNKYCDVSLNDCLIPGPDLTNSLLGVLTRFRQEPVAFMADVESMFYRVRVPQEDRDALRYLWWVGGDTAQSPKTFRMTVHLFGAASSPSCANFALRKAAEDARDSGQVSQEVYTSVTKNFYVDDCLKSAKDEEQAIQLATGLRKACANGGFRLTKFISTSVNLLKTLPDTERAKSLQDVHFDEDKNNPLSSLQERALGVLWDVATDAFRITAKKPEKRTTLTKRSILAVLSAVYDPLGMAAPFVIIARMLFRDLTKETVNWDEDLSSMPHLSQQWKKWVGSLESLNRTTVPRCFRHKANQPSNQNEDAWELHVFCDASENAYAAVAYLRQWHEQQGEAHIAFVMGKARVSPPKVVTIPRLELTAAKLATEVVKIIQQELQYNVQKRAFWTDSQTVLKYLSNKVRRFHTFVANRINSILDASLINEWRYVPTNQNPADEGSRGIQAEALPSSMWLRGPEFLSRPEKDWPTHEPVQVEEDDPEVRVLATTATPEESDSVFIERLAARYSTVSKLKSAICTWKNFIEYLKLGRHQIDSRCTTKEAEDSLLRALQRATWPKEWQGLSNGQPLARSSTLFKLSPMMSKDNTLIMNSRTRAHLPILPGHSKVAELIVRSAHEEQAHFGKQMTSAHVLRSYWIVGLGRVVRTVIKNCPKCQRRTASPATPAMAALPDYRMEIGHAFQSTGVDYFGPFLVKKENAKLPTKLYGVIFTCATTRAVHLEAAEDLSSSSFLNALRRFTARRGHVKRLVSDNGTNFVGAESAMSLELKKELHRLQSKGNDITEWVKKRGIKWEFNPPGASHHGGFWERIIRSIRRALTVLLPERRPLTYDGMITVLCEIESILNNRPLTSVSDDPNDFEPLTPNHLLLGREGPVAPPGDFKRACLPLKKQWRYVQHIAAHFWRRWIAEYKVLLHQRSKWHVDGNRPLEVGDVVLLLDSSKPREYWALGRIEELHPGKDQKVRVVTVATAKGSFKRPVTKLCLLEAASDSNK